MSQVNFDDQEELRFVAIGDWGSGQSGQRKVAEAMGQWCQHSQSDFILSVGDNFYSIGAYSLEDEQFDKKWRNMYNHPSIENLPW